MDKLRQTVEKCSDVSKCLMEKMGWKPGQGLGKNEQGNKVDPNEDKPVSQWKREEHKIEIKYIG